MATPAFAASCGVLAPRAQTPATRLAPPRRCSPAAAPPVRHETVACEDPASAAVSAAAASGLAPGEVLVRFVNTPQGEDVLVPALPGDNLLNVGDGAGVHIPRGCRSGLCGACTSDVVCRAENGGTQVVRACQAGVSVMPGEAEMVVDVRRIGEAREGKDGDPMARFDDLDFGYVAGAAPRPKGAVRVRECVKCGASGDIVCYACDGAGIMPENGKDYDCTLCMGTGNLRCAACQGTGQIMK
jgi:hypothetical protein